MDYTAIAIFVAGLVIALVVYFNRIEKALTKIKTDICWIKKRLEECQPL